MTDPAGFATSRVLPPIESVFNDSTDFYQLFTFHRGFQGLGESVGREQCVNKAPATGGT